MNGREAIGKLRSGEVTGVRRNSWAGGAWFTDFKNRVLSSDDTGVEKRTVSTGELAQDDWEVRYPTETEE